MIYLSRNKHRSPEDGMCLMEAVALAKGEWTDRPKCVDPRLHSIGQALNDFAPISRRQELVVLIPKLFDTAYDGKQERRNEILSEGIELRRKGPLNHWDEYRDFFVRLIEAKPKMRFNPIVYVERAEERELVPA